MKESTSLILGAASSGLGFLSGAYNSAQSFSRQKDLLRMQQQYAVQNWNAQNAYNTPKAQMERLRDAGLNPNLMYDGGAGSLQADTIGNSSAPSVAMSSPVGNFFGEAAQAMQSVALAKNAGAETAGKLLENEWMKATLDERIVSVGKQNRWTDEQIKNMQAKTNEVNANIGLIDKTKEHLSAVIANLDANTELSKEQKELVKKEVANYQRECNARIAQMIDSANLSNSQATYFRETMASVIALNTANAEQSSASAFGIGLQNALTSKYGEAEKIMGLINSGCDSVNKILEGLLGSLPKGIANGIGHVIAKLGGK